MSPGEDPERLLDEARAGQRPLEDALDALLDAELILALAEDGEQGDRAFPVTTADEDGNPLIPVFTSEAQVPPELGDAQRLTGRLGVFLEGWPDGVGLVVNPSSEAGLIIPAGDVAGLRAAGAQDEAPAGLQVALGEPAVEPTELLERFAAAAEQTPEVLAVFRAQAVWRAAEGDEPGLLVGLHLASGADGELVVGRVVELVGPTDGRFDAFGFDDLESPDPLVQQLVTRTTPVWRREP